MRSCAVVTTALLYFVAAGLTVWIGHRLVAPVPRWVGVALLLLPLCFTGRALLTGGIYAPTDLPLTTEPFRYMQEVHGVSVAHNPLLSDVYCLNIPWKYAVRVAYSRGELALWSPFVFGGDILGASAQPTPFEPYFLLSLLLPMGNSLTFIAAITFFLAGLCMYFYCRDLDCGDVPALFGAAAWMYGSMMVFWLEWVITASMLWLPLVFLGIRRIIRGGTRGFSILTTAFVMMLLSGHPETALHVVFIGLFYSLFELTARFGWRRSMAHQREILAIALRGTGAGVLALALIAVYLLPIIEALPQTMEHHFRETWVALQDPSPPLDHSISHLKRNFVPFRYGFPPEEASNAPAYPLPDTSYPGSVVFCAALFALWRSSWKGKWFYAALAVFGYLAGTDSYPTADLLSKLPLFHIAINRRLIFAALFSLAVLGALGVAAAARERRKGAVVSGAVTAALAIAVVMAWPDMRGGGLAVDFLRAETVKLLAPPLLAALVLAIARSERAVTVALLALLLAQRTAEMGSFYPTLPSRAFYPPVPELALMEKSAEPYRVVGLNYALVPNTATMYQLEDVRGYQAMTFRRKFDTFSIWSVAQPVWFNRVTDLTRPFLSMQNVRYAIASPGIAEEEGWSVVTSTERMTLLENRNVIPRAWVPHTVRINYTHGVTLAEMASQPDFREVGWVEHPKGGASPGEIPNGPGYVTTRAPKLGTRLLDVRLLNDSWVFVSETAWKGWKAYANGRRVPLRFGNHAFLALYLPAGKHQVELIYRPRSFDVGAIVSGLTLAGLLTYGALLRRRRRTSALSSQL
jgi:hypothetical protein